MADEPTPSELLHQRLDEIARRRVPESAVESVVAATLRRIDEEADGREAARPSLLRCLTLLREQILAHYQEHPPELLWPDWTEDRAPVVVEAMDDESLRRVAEAALDELEEESPATCVYLRQLAGGATPREISERVHVGLAVLRQRVQRGRDLFDRLLVARGART